MKNRQAKVVVIVVASTFGFGVVRAAQDRYTLKDGNGISFSDFKGYDAWQVASVSQPDDASGCGTSKTGCTKAILANPTMIKAYEQGIPANGKPFPDGAALAKVEWLKARNTSSPYPVTIAGAQTEVSFMLKDSKRFPQTNGWGYATFKYDAASSTYKPAHTDGAFAKTCHGCHTTGAKARDFVYTSFAKR